MSAKEIGELIYVIATSVAAVIGAIRALRQPPAPLADVPQED